LNESVVQLFCPTLRLIKSPAISNIVSCDNGSLLLSFSGAPVRVMIFGFSSSELVFEFQFSEPSRRNVK